MKVTMTAPDSPDTSLCPLCQSGNECVMARPETAGNPCWCTGATIPAGLLSRVPPELAGLACICPACVEAYGIEATRAPGFDRT